MPKNFVLMSVVLCLMLGACVGAMEPEPEPEITAQKKALPTVCTQVECSPSGCVARAGLCPSPEWLVHDAEQCPDGYRHVSLDAVLPVLDDTCELFGDWYIVRLADGASVDGPGYQCRSREADERSLGHSLCEPDPAQCSPLNCEQQEAECDTVSDGCGGVIDCGDCLPPASCGGDGVANQCG